MSSLTTLLPAIFRHSRHINPISSFSERVLIHVRRKRSSFFLIRERSPQSHSHIVTAFQPIFDSARFVAISRLILRLSLGIQYLVLLLGTFDRLQVDFKC